MKIAQIAIPSPLHRLFDYQWPFTRPIEAGLRVAVPFGRRAVTGVVVGAVDQSLVPQDRLRMVSDLLDQAPLLSAELLLVLRWAGSYYHHPIGEVLANALPLALRRGGAAELPVLECFRRSEQPFNMDALHRAPLQARLLTALQAAGSTGLAAERLKAISVRWRTALRPLLSSGVVERFEIAGHVLNTPEDVAPELTEEQAAAVEAVSSDAENQTFQCFLLNGITGSGKTEVYLQLIRRQINAGRQSLVLVPEISLTPQLLNRFQRRLPGVIVSLHSGLSDTERLHHWLLAANGTADVIIGTRSAIFTPLPRAGLIVVDEEHDASLKQQDGFRYHARDMALMRARNIGCPVVLGTATPSLESLNNARSGRFHELRLTRRAGDAEAPAIGLLDIRRRRLVSGLSDRLLTEIRSHLEQDGQALIFLNRRGYAPTLLCNDCGAAAECHRCDAHMTVHAQRQLLRCHYCGAERRIPAACVQCGSERLDTQGVGTEQIEQVLQQEFPGVGVVRIDRDSTRRKGALQQQLAAAINGEARLLVGTQMLAKGHHFPSVTLVGILDTDRGLYGTDYRALEQMGQLIIQVAGRAGREQRRGQVLIQTRSPDNPLLQTLVRDGYDAFAQCALDDRRAAALPPFSYVALIRAEAAGSDAPQGFLCQVAAMLANLGQPGLQYFGPVPAPRERIGGRYRAQLMVQSERRSTLNQALAAVCLHFEALPMARRIRWSIDVDPVDFL